MGQITLVFHGRLNDFLQDRKNEDTVVFDFAQKTALKHVVEVLGVPHPEVGHIELNGKVGNLESAVQDGNIFDIYPYQPAVDQYGESGPMFVLDNHLGKLAGYMRLLGFDVIYVRDWSDEQIADYARGQQRIVLTRDRGLLKRKIVNQGYCVRADNPGEQLAEVVALYHLNQYVIPFQRCPLCNGKLEGVSKDQIIDQLLPLTRKYYDEFTRCQDCGKIYWKGSHFAHMQNLFKPYLGSHTPREI